ncbi:hypothetical protein H310_14386 [Aphanomyces invadans]|uniref:U2A'/phosphoprotein 32 family A C-terminal domain-containing protein n=1 Tax=Aphanomyces invadans TaxID=157072 RepID=A0A024TA99_9STRA|nr:hypothetical protein H310_14386 [Aphanomyces invadans]ETV90894.1 hypothetical protein H310_14386 [Aphanomyces invadans]|eukprot:XP_008880459.1 hypothetical protein H310_14386 [Aphanomyces invadans]
MATTHKDTLDTMTMRVSKPHDELAVCNEKYVKDCTELVMSSRGIDVIGNFDAFVSLEVLWLNSNNIESITGLDSCVRIQYLYLQNNRISSLDGSLRHFSFLKELRLYNNMLQDLHTTLKLLEKFVHLDDLDLFGNPLAEEDKYRLHVIASIPSLHVLDRHVITLEERVAAKKLAIKRSGLSATASPHGRRPKVSTAERYAPLSGTVKMLLKEVATIEREQQQAQDLERKKCFDLISETNVGPGPTSPHTTDAAKGMARACGMDEWVFCHLRKVFRNLDSKKLGGVLGTQFPTLVSEMLDQGHQLIWNDQPLTEESNISALLPLLGKSIGPDPDDDDEKPRHLIAWGAFSQALTQKHVGPNHEPLFWAPLGLAALAERSEDYFDKAKALEKKLSVMATHHNELKQQVHVFTQRGYHLDALKEQLSSLSKDEFVLHHREQQHQTRPAVLRDSVSLYSYKTKGRHHVGDDDVTGASIVSLAKKYHVKSKDFQTFLQAKEARKPVRVSKESIAV